MRGGFLMSRSTRRGRSLSGDGSLKSLDFIVSPPGRTTWLVDVKGRRFPSGDECKTYWKNWSTRDDLKSLAEWHAHFGGDFRPLLVFAYHLVAGRSPLPTEQLFEFRGARYGFLGVTLTDYVPHARQISARWDTVAMPTALFRRAARPMEDVLGGTPVGAIAGLGDWQAMPAHLQWET